MRNAVHIDVDGYQVRDGGPSYLQFVGKRTNGVQMLLVAERLHGFGGTEMELR